MLTRTFGPTGEKVSVFGFGGIVVKGVEQQQANNYVAEAIDRGINYFDVAPTYGDAQDRLGPALQPFRDDVLLACKTGKRTKEAANEELHESLRLLKTDHFDIYQLHGIDDPEEIKTVLGPGGALEAIIEAKEKGLVRFIGFSCHDPKAALKLMSEYDFDTVLFPINWSYWLNNDAGEQVLKTAKSKNMGRIAMKGLADRKWREDEEKILPNTWYKPIFDDKRLATLALRFTLSQAVHVALSPGDVSMLRLGLDIVEKLDKIELSAEEFTELEERANKVEPIFAHHI